MKRSLPPLLLAVLMIGAALPAAAQTEKGLNYQAVARDASGDPLVNTGITVRFILRRNNAIGPITYDETHTPTTNDRGLFTVVIGEGTPSSGVYADIDWGGYDHFLQVVLNGTTVGTEELQGVPYAKWAKNGSKWMENGAELYYDVDNVGIGLLDPAYRLDVLGPTSSTLSIINSNVNHSNSFDTRAVSGTSVPVPGYGVGLYGQGGYRGLEALGNGGTYTGNTYGVYATASGTAGDRYGTFSAATGGVTSYGLFASASGTTNSYGIYATAPSGINRWAGYFTYKVQITNGEEAGLTTDGHLQLGGTTGLNLVMDNNEITARNNGAESTLYLQPNQGPVTIGTTAGALDAALTVDNTIGAAYVVRFRNAGSSRFAVHSNGGTSIGGLVVPPTNGLQVSGNVAIGSVGEATGYRVSVDGKIMCEELRVQNSTAWPDYVFTSEHERPTLPELEERIGALGHLPGVPSAAQVEEDGVMVGDMQRILLEKVEELTLYLIETGKRVDALEAENEALRKAAGK